MSKSAGVLNLEDALETGVSTAKRGAKTVANAVSDTGKAAASQITGQRNRDTQDIVESLYGKSGGKIGQSSNESTNQNSQQPEDTAQGIEKKKKLQELRAQLHNEVYYDPLVNPPKPKEEERPAEKVERDKMQDLKENEQKKKDKPPPLVQKTQQRVEKYPGTIG